MSRVAKSLCVVALGIVCSQAQAENRVALVIGNSAYEKAGPLANPKNDAVDVATALRALGFQIIDGLDLSKVDMERKIRSFSESLVGAELGVFYYAGHGIQANGQNYLLPVDAKLDTPSALDFEAVSVDLVQRVMERESQTNILFLDACRDNPLARNLARAMGTRSAYIGRGLAPQETGAGTLISFSTQPGNVALDGAGRNSPYASALLRRISAADEDISSMLIDVRNDVMRATANRQVPWEHSALRARLFLAKASAAERVAPAASAVDVQNQAAPPVQVPAPEAAAKPTFDGEWEVVGTGGPGCNLKNWKNRVVIRGHEIQSGYREPGRISADGRFSYNRPAWVDANIIGTFTGKLENGFGSGTYKFGVSCTGSIALKRM